MPARIADASFAGPQMGRHANRQDDSPSRRPTEPADGLQNARLARTRRTHQDAVRPTQNRRPVEGPRGLAYAAASTRDDSRAIWCRGRTPLALGTTGNRTISTHASSGGGVGGGRGAREYLMGGRRSSRPRASDTRPSTARSSAGQLTVTASHLWVRPRQRSVLSHETRCEEPSLSLSWSLRCGSPGSCDGPPVCQARWLQAGQSTCSRSAATSPGGCGCPIARPR